MRRKTKKVIGQSMIDSLGFYCNNFNLLELVWYEFRNRVEFCWNFPFTRPSLCWPWRLRGLPCLRCGPRLLINGPWKEGVECVGAFSRAFLGEETNRKIYLEAYLGCAFLEREVNQPVLASIWIEKKLHLVGLWCLQIRRKGQISEIFTTRNSGPSTTGPSRADKNGHRVWGSAASILQPF